MYNLKSSLERWLKKEGVTDTEAECVLSNSNMIQGLILDSVFSAGGRVWPPNHVLIILSSNKTK